MRRAQAFVLVGACVAGPLTANSLDLWISLIERGNSEANEAKASLMECPGLEELHHKIHARVGERAWENRVKPDFMRAITLMTVRDNGNPFPDWKDVVEWARTHPKEACAALEGAARGMEHK